MPNPGRMGPNKSGSTKLKRGALLCFYLNARGKQCLANVCFTDGDGVNYCLTHKNMHFVQGLGNDMRNGVISKAIDEVGLLADIGLPIRPVEPGFVPDVDAINSVPVDERPQLPKTRSRALGNIKPKTHLYSKEDEPNEYGPGSGRGRKRIQWKDNPMAPVSPQNTVNGNLRTGQNVRQFAGLDFDFYGANFNNNQFFLVDEAVKMSYAWLNVLLHQLQLLELDEEELKLVEMWGVKEFEGQPVHFNENIRKHSTPLELKIKLFDSFKKAMDSFRGCLKDRMELLPTALMVLRSFGIKFDKSAGMMVLSITEKLNDDELVKRGLMPNRGSGLPVEAILAESKKELTDDDW